MAAPTHRQRLRLRTEKPGDVGTQAAKKRGARSIGRFESVERLAVVPRAAGRVLNLAKQDWESTNQLWQTTNAVSPRPPAAITPHRILIIVALFAALGM